MQIIVIALGGAVGAVLRYLVSILVISLAGDSWPYGTLAVNLVGSFFIGFLWQFFDTVTYPHNTRLLVFTGGLGAFTTFSTFGLESLTLLQAGRSRAGLLYLLASNAGGLLCVWLGFSRLPLFLSHACERRIERMILLITLISNHLNQGIYGLLSLILVMKLGVIAHDCHFV